MKIPAPVSLAMLLAMTLVGAFYMSFSVLELDLLQKKSHVTVMLESSGGLMETSLVSLRGMKVGRVQHISTSSDGLAVSIELAGEHKIPADSEVRIANLSAAGEQYLDFRPDSDSGPYLTDGAVIPSSRVHTSATVSEVLGKVDALLSQIDPTVVDSLVDTFVVGFKGREDEVANLTTSMRLLADTLEDKEQAIRRLYVNGQTLGDHFDGYGPVLGAAKVDVDHAIPELINLVRAFEDYSHAGSGIWEQPIGPALDKIDEYLSLLSPDLAAIASILKPVTDPLRPLRVNVGSIVDLLSGAFPEGGPARVTVNVPK